MKPIVNPGGICGERSLVDRIWSSILFCLLEFEVYVWMNM